jgi:predicted heme/steroid binding protein
MDFSLLDSHQELLLDNLAREWMFGKHNRNYDGIFYDNSCSHSWREGPQDSLLKKFL